MQFYNKATTKMISFCGVIKDETEEHNTNWPEIPDNP